MGVGFPAGKSTDVAGALRALEEQFSSLNSFIAQCRMGDGPTPFILMEQIQDEFEAWGRSLAPLCLYSLLLCAAFAQCFPDSSPDIRLGGRHGFPCIISDAGFLALGDFL